MKIRKGITEDLTHLIRWSQDETSTSFLKNKEEIEITGHFMLEANGRVIGTIYTYDLDAKNGVFSYYVYIDPSHRRMGYATEGVKLLLRLFFNELRYQKANAPIYAFNKVAATLHEKMGFEMEGRLKRMVFSRGQYFDLFFYGITVSEFENILTDPIQFQSNETTTFLND